MLSSLTGAIVTEVKRSPPDVIVASYLEPYGMAALLSRECHRIPTFIRHAGSDVGALARHPYIGAFYAAYAGRSSGILTYADQSGNRDLLEIGFDERQIICMPPVAHFPSHMSDEALDLEDTKGLALRHFDGYLAPDAMDILREINSPLFSLHEGPVIGIYGKAGHFKGTFELIEALDRCARAGHKFRFCIVLAGWQPVIEAVLRKIAGSAIKDMTAVLPPLHPDDIAAFLAACDWVAFLENSFPIEAHTPRVPFEVMSAGKLLIIAEEQIRKSNLSPPLQHLVNAIVVPGPVNATTIADALTPVLRDESQRRAMESRARLLRKLLNLTGSRWHPGDNDMLAAVAQRLACLSQS